MSQILTPEEIDAILVGLEDGTMSPPLPLGEGQGVREPEQAWDPATSDGCTLFPDGKWAGCCLDHDRAYFHGGTWADKRMADVQLRRCVAALGHPVTAWVMWIGVSLFGWAFFPFGPSWGYGKAKDTPHA